MATIRSLVGGDDLNRPGIDGGYQPPRDGSHGGTPGGGWPAEVQVGALPNCPVRRLARSLARRMARGLPVVQDAVEGEHDEPGERAGEQQQLAGGGASAQLLGVVGQDAAVQLSRRGWLIAR